MILVFGSINIDLVTRVPHIPKPGETVLSPRYETFFGGKGANQAVAAARASLAETVVMAGAVGDDGFGRSAVDNLERQGVGIACIALSPEPTGCAFITVDPSGENAITVASGANAGLAPAAADGFRPDPATVAILQMEVPAASSLAVARRVRAAGGRTIWNLAPATAGISSDDLAAIFAASSFVVMNEHEAITAAAASGESTEDPIHAAAAVAVSRSTACIATLGPRGAVAIEPDGTRLVVPAPAIDPVDTTGAGDAFVGLLAAFLHEGMDIGESMRLACAGAALACLKSGAQSAMPSRKELNAFAH
jgi:ribokinase